MKTISVLFAIFIVTVVVLADNGSLPHSIRAIYDFPNGDKLGHFILFGLLNFFITLAFFSSPRFQNRNLVALSIGLILALLIGAEEWSQQFFSSRTMDLFDLLASYTGLLAGGWAAIKQKKDPKKKDPKKKDPKGYESL